MTDPSAPCLPPTLPTTSEHAGREWFDAIALWPPPPRRVALLAGTMFAGLIALPLAMWAFLPPAPSGSLAPLPEWDLGEFVTGQSTRAIETWFKQRSWITFGSAGAHAELRHRLGLQPPGQLGLFDFETADGESLANGIATAIERGFVVPVPWETPRPRLMIAPDQTFYLRYRDNEVLRRDWFDAKDRVKVRINQYGLRERDDLLEKKPPGEKRVLCLGDSLAFGWGVPEELCWVRLVENELRRTDDRVRTINCGGTMAVCADEYWYALKNRFFAFEPDVVVVTLSVGDLVPSSGLSVQAPADTATSPLRATLRGETTRGPLDLDPDVDWVQMLLDLPEKEGTLGGLYEATDKPYSAMWSQGTPQRSLASMKAWCEPRNIRLVVTLWPFLQGLGPGHHYPFERLHELVAAECEAQGITFVDVLPALRHVPQQELWVTPADMHPNPKGHRLGAPAIASAVRAALAER